MTDVLTVIGAGLVGSLLALSLARRGHMVEVFERRADPRRTALPGGRSINLALSTRGLHALQSQGLAAAVLREALPIRGRMIHSGPGEPHFLPYGRDDQECIYSISRAALNHVLLTAAEATGRVSVRFGQRLVGFSATTRAAEFIDEASGQVVRRDVPVMFGTDGSDSVVRAALADSAGARVTRDTLDSGYKELTIRPRDDGPFGRFALDPNALHIWPRGRFMLIALPNVDGSFTLTLFLPVDATSGAPSFACLRDPDSVGRCFARHFPDVAPLIHGMPDALLAAPLGRMCTVATWPWNHAGAVLLGDAAHAIVPFLGQGMNAGFEDCTTLTRLLDAAGHAPDWPRVFRALAAERKPDTDAIAGLALENYVEMRDRVADPSFLLRRCVEAEFERRYPGEYRSRYQLVTFTRVPYRVAAEVGRHQDEILGELCAGKDRAADVDYARARELVAARLGPLLREHGLGGPR